MLVIAGDMNATHTNWDVNGHTNNYGNAIYDLVTHHGLTQIVKETTHTTHTPNGPVSSLLDLIITDTPGNFLNVAVDTYPSSDHKFVSAVSVLEVPQPKKTYREIDDYSQLTDEKKTELNDLLKAAPWDELVFNDQNSNDIDKLVEAWVALFLTIVRQFVPTKTVVTDYSKPGWWTRSLTKQQRYKTFCLRKLKKVTKRGNIRQIEAAKEKFRVAKENLDRKKKVAAERYRRDLQETLNSKTLSAKGYWNCINKLMGRLKRSTIPPLKKGTTFVTNSLQKCDLLNSYFSAQCHLNDSNHKFPDVPLLTNSLLISTQIEDTAEIYNMLRKLDIKRATGPDKISNKLLRLSAFGIADSVTKLINNSLSLGQFPTAWKKAHVVPIHKKDSVHEAQNYRPISLLSCLSKICERVVSGRLRHHIECNNILSPFQSGYRTGFSTETQLSGLLHKILHAVDQGQMVRAVFLDISKAFDRVSHKGLIIRLQQVGIAGTMLKWFRSYLSNREQRVVIDGVSSSWLPVSSGVPQGSVLGPLLFILYINELLREFDCHVHCYADDTLLFETGTCSNTVNQKLSNNLVKATQWGNDWLVTFNQAKTESMTFGARSAEKPTLLDFQGSQVKEVHEHKHLGLMLTSNLRWDTQVAVMAEKAEKRLRYLILGRSHLSQAVLCNVYLTLIRSIMEYCCATWSNISAISSTRLQRIQNRAARLVTGAARYTSTLSLHRELGWPLLEQRRKYFRLAFMHRAAHEELPQYLQTVIPPRKHILTTHETAPSKHYATSTHNSEILSYRKQYANITVCLPITGKKPPWQPLRNG